MTKWFRILLERLLAKIFGDAQRQHAGQRSRSRIIADLDSLTETEIEQDGKRFIVRSAPRPAASLAIRAASRELRSARLTLLLNSS